MTHYHLYIMEDGPEVGPSSKFFKVAIGTNVQATRDYLFLTAHAVEHGHYFEMWSHDVDVFLAHLDKSLDGQVVYSMTPIKARDLVRNIKANTAAPLDADTLHNADHLRYCQNLSYRIFSNLNRGR